jgi:hypothetical protein
VRALDDGATRRALVDARGRDAQSDGGELGRQRGVHGDDDRGRGRRCVRRDAIVGAFILFVAYPDEYALGLASASRSGTMSIIYFK